MTKVVISDTLESGADRVVIRGDVAAELEAMKRQDGKDIILSCGPATLAPLASTPALIDEYLLPVSPAVVAAGPQLFEGLSTNLALELAEVKAFSAGAVVLWYRVLPSTARR